MGCVHGRPDFTTEEGAPIVLGARIAEGGFSEVFQGFDMHSSRSIAVKRLAFGSTREQGERALEEISVLRALSGCKHVIRLLGVAKETNALYLVFPLARNGSVQQRLENLAKEGGTTSLKEVVGWTRSLLSALAALHSQGIAHRDVKPANLLLMGSSNPDANPNAKLTDFGSVCRVPVTIENAAQSRHWRDECAELCSMSYRAPELFSADIGTVVRSSIDVWAAGCCLYAFLYLQSPFDKVAAQGGSVAMATLSPETIALPESGASTSTLRDMIHRSLVVDSAARAAADQLLAQLDFEHP